LERHPRPSRPLALLLTGGLLALAAAGCGGTDKITPVSDPTGATTPKPTVKFSGSGGLVSLGGKSGKGGNGNGGGHGGNGNGWANLGGGHGGKGNGNGNGNNANANGFPRTDGNPKTSSQPGDIAGAVDCKTNDSGDSGKSGDSGNSSDCVATINCTNVRLPGPECCPFPIPSDEGGGKRKGSSKGDCPKAESDQTKSSSDKQGHKGKGKGKSN
jgi:hypothetical protein